MAYYSNTDSTIHSAAAGLGAVAGPLYVGGKRVTGPLTIQHFAGTGKYGPLRAVNDGSLGDMTNQPAEVRAVVAHRAWKDVRALGLEFLRASEGYIAGTLPPEQAYNQFQSIRYRAQRMLDSYRDLVARRTSAHPAYRWSLEPLAAMVEGCHIGAMATKAGLRGLGSDSGRLKAYADGILGAISGAGPLRAVNDGSLGEYFATNGLGEYFSPNGGCAGCGRGMGEYFATNGLGEYFSTNGLGEYFSTNGLGAFAATGVVLDLNVPATLDEVKMWVHALAAAAGVSTAGAVTDSVYRESDSALLTQSLTKLYGDVGANLTVIAGGLAYPSGAALVTLSDKVQTQMPEGNATMFETLFPNISAFIKANFAANVDSSGKPLPLASWTYGTVIPPGVKAPGLPGGMTATTMALLGVGALVAGFFVVRAVSR